MQGLVHCHNTGFYEDEMQSTAEEGNDMMGLHTCQSPNRAGSVCNLLPGEGHGTCQELNKYGIPVK